MEPYVLTYIPTGKKMNMDELIDKIGKEKKICVYPIYRGWIDMDSFKSIKIQSGCLET